MSAKRELKKISELEVGDFNGYIIVRVERIIRVQQVVYPLGPHRPMIEPKGIHIVVFDGSVSFSVCPLLLRLSLFLKPPLYPSYYVSTVEDESVADV